MNVDRLYTLSKVQRDSKANNVNKGKNSRRNFKRRSKKRKLKDNSSDPQGVNKRRKIG